MKRCTNCKGAKADLTLIGRHDLICGECWKEMVQREVIKPIRMVIKH